MKVPPEAVSKILAAVSENGLLRLHKEYRARNVYDGTQWVLRITQGENEKRVYFNNYFPGAITHFAESLDDILVESGVRQIRWEQVPETENRLHEKDLWSSVQR